MKKKIKDLLYKIKKKVLVSYYGFLTTIKILIDVLDSITRYLFRELIQATVCIIILFTIFGITITIFFFILYQIHFPSRLKSFVVQVEETQVFLVQAELLQILFDVEETQGCLVEIVPPGIA